MRFWLGPDLNITVKNPTDIRMLLTSNKVNQKGPVYEFMKLYIGPGILTGGPTWRNHRKIATPSYSKKAVHHFSSIFNEEAEELTRVLLNKDPGITFNVYHAVVRATTLSVCQTLMGLSKEDTNNIRKLNEVVTCTPDLYSLIFQKMTRWWYHIPLLFRLIGAKKKEDYYLGLINEMASDIVDKRRKALAENKHVNEDMMGIVDRYILSGELDEREIVCETFSLFTTSQEASAKLASAVLLFLAHLPDWQEKVYKEIVDVLGPAHRHVNEDDLKKLSYLDMVYKEALRFLAIAALIQRTVEEDVTINGGKITLPAGTTLALLIHDLHRDPQYWDEPNKVKPERFMPENMKGRDTNAFIPFSLGAMDCLGRVYATSLIKTMVVHTVRHLHLEADGLLEDLELHVAISVKFAKGYNLRVRPRHFVEETIPV